MHWWGKGLSISLLWPNKKKDSLWEICILVWTRNRWHLLNQAETHSSAFHTNIVMFMKIFCHFSFSSCFLNLIRPGHILGLPQFHVDIFVEKFWKWNPDFLGHKQIFSNFNLILDITGLDGVRRPIRFRIRLWIETFLRLVYAWIWNPNPGCFQGWFSLKYEMLRQI